MNTTHSTGFEAVHAVGTLLSGLTVPWWITGGWAIDLAVGQVTRDHADVNVMMLERDEHALRGLTEVDIQLIADGQPPGPWPAWRRLAVGPPPGPKPPITGPDRLVLRGEDLPLPAEVIPASAVGAFWVYRRGARIFTRPLADITRYWHGIPFLAPEVVLLIKARPGLDQPGADNDQRDFEAARPMLSAGQRAWLKDALERQSWLKDALDRQPRPKDEVEPQLRRKERIEPQPRVSRRHRWAAELTSDPHRPA
jgi:Aminoglycoside-2''-adenylyltransferase